MENREIRIINVINDLNFEMATNLIPGGLNIKCVNKEHIQKQIEEKLKCLDKKEIINALSIYLSKYIYVIELNKDLLYGE